MDDPATGDSVARDERLLGAVNAALDDLLGPEPTGLVEERPETVDPSVEAEAMAHLYRSPSRFHGSAERPEIGEGPSQDGSRGGHRGRRSRLRSTSGR